MLLSWLTKGGGTYIFADGSLVEQGDGPGGQALLGLALRDVPELLSVLLLSDTHVTSDHGGDDHTLGKNTKNLLKKLHKNSQVFLRLDSFRPL